MYVQQNFKFAIKFLLMLNYLLRLNKKLLTWTHPDKISSFHGNQL